MSQNNGMENNNLLALTGLNVVIEDESDYVFVAGKEEDDAIANGAVADDRLFLNDEDDDEWDDESYDQCDLSPSLSCATSVATNVTLRDLNLIEDSGVMTMDVDNNDDGKVHASSPMDTDEGNSTRLGAGTAFAASASSSRNKGGGSRSFPTSNPKNGRRLSNKKLRKKMKMLKKAAAARAAAETLAAQMMSSSAETMASSDAPAEAEGVAAAAATVAGVETKKRAASTKTSSGSPKRKPTNLAVTCARESLAAYREEIEAGKVQMKKTRAVSIDIP